MRKLEQLKMFKKKIHYDGDYLRMTEYGDNGKVGDGGYGKVYVVKKFNDKETLYAMKKLAPDVDEISVIKEINILQKLKGHPNIIELVDICKSKETNRLSRLVFPYIDSYNYKSLFPTLAPENVQSLMIQLLNAVQFMHKKGVVHCDLKNRNLLIDKNYHLKVIDFGQAHRSDIKKKNSFHVGTLPYKPPEILMKTPFYDISLDMWEVGRIFLELLVPRSRNFFKIDKAHRAPHDENHAMLEKWAMIFGTEAIVKLARKYNYQVPSFRKERAPSSIKTWLKWFLSSESEEDGEYEDREWDRYRLPPELKSLELLVHLLEDELDEFEEEEEDEDEEDEEEELLDDEEEEEDEEDRFFFCLRGIRSASTFTLSFSLSLA